MSSCRIAPQTFAAEEPQFRTLTQLPTPHDRRLRRRRQQLQAIQHRAPQAALQLRPHLQRHPILPPPNLERQPPTLPRLRRQQRAPPPSPGVKAASSAGAEPSRPLASPTSPAPLLRWQCCCWPPAPAFAEPHGPTGFFNGCRRHYGGCCPCQAAAPVPMPAGSPGLRRPLPLPWRWGCWRGVDPRRAVAQHRRRPPPPWAAGGGSAARRACGAAGGGGSRPASAWPLCCRYITVALRLLLGRIGAVPVVNNNP